ncbi:pyridoxamine 5'-phosphate oxidase family protein [Agromyces rhizosphaerae]|uniref:pyridoxamine 5'-phosphate oxidase family protein n=1 Tax=Agromyces rhizosphaerae TaxID=88374 RepID=UPI00248F7B68|nr:pyridoxamine 5'-phosphate oxidase family protein [Agromyces rhizosphaerae]
MTTEQVWEELAKRPFIVVGTVTGQGEARTAGVLPHVADGVVWFTTYARMWKARHIAANPHVSVTAPAHRRVWFAPWVRIPDATITFRGTAEVVPAERMPREALDALTHGLDLAEDGPDGPLVGIAIRPRGDFVTYGIGVPVMAMTDPARAAGRAPTGAPAGDPELTRRAVAR